MVYPQHKSRHCLCIRSPARERHVDNAPYAVAATLVCILVSTECGVRCSDCCVHVFQSMPYWRKPACDLWGCITDANVLDQCDTAGPTRCIAAAYMQLAVLEHVTHQVLQYVWNLSDVWNIYMGCTKALCSYMESILHVHYMTAIQYNIMTKYNDSICSLNIHGFRTPGGQCMLQLRYACLKSNHAPILRSSDPLLEDMCVSVWCMPHGPPRLQQLLHMH